MHKWAASGVTILMRSWAVSLVAREPLSGLGQLRKRENPQQATYNRRSQNAIPLSDGYFMK